MTIFSENFSATPYWWDHAPRPGGFDNPLPRSADVLIVGSGYTGLHAAIQTAAKGKAYRGGGCGGCGLGLQLPQRPGQLSTSIKPGYGELAVRYGRDKAIAILMEGRNALDWLENFIQQHAIDCDFRKTGRFHAAHTPAALDAMRKTT